MIWYNVHVVLRDGGVISYNMSEKNALASITDMHSRYSISEWHVSEVQHPPVVQQCEFCDEDATFVTIHDTPLCDGCADDCDLERT